MFTSLSTALSALSATSTAIDVVGNNLANLDTLGFKASEVSFQDLLSQSISSGAGQTQIGFGVGTPTTQFNFSQGALQTTSGPLDVAIQGDGFFLVKTPTGAIDYTRAGNFQLDSLGNLTTATGDNVQGWTLSGGVLNTNAPVTNITLPASSLAAPVATSSFSLAMNLNAAAVVGSADATFSTSIQVYDSLGNARAVTATFTKDPAVASQWDYSVSVPDADVANPPATPLTGSVTFDSNGNLVTPAATDPPAQLQVQGLADGASDLSLTWNLYQGTAPQITQYAQASAVSAVTQDGSAAAQLSQVALSANGAIVAQYSNGLQTVIGQLAMATIQNPQSLIADGNNNYGVSALTALPAVGIPSTGGRGSVTAGAVESSNVDIAQEFTNLIVFQRAYQANAKVVITVDTLTQATINLVP
jgi:flagellar hook protein FlgE